jgi:hypothetical protein
LGFGVGEAFGVDVGFGVGVPIVYSAKLHSATRSLAGVVNVVPFTVPAAISEMYAPGILTLGAEQAESIRGSLRSIES